ncbi:hypothetical protein KKH15_01755 [Patescibacteria group bacterium]|nr:hypothetical protein [Patescibacteria group bacterium]MBU1754773.1 hypothetical protein [Patescibacteria group bacterium]
MKTKYIPGVCNIGPAEIKMRERVGWYALGATALLGIVLVASDAPEWSKVVLFFPATVSALGFLQAWFHFCVAYGTQGLFNVSDAVAKTESISQKEFRKKDQQRSIMIIVSAVVIGMVITASAFAS